MTNKEHNPLSIACPSCDQTYSGGLSVDCFDASGCGYWRICEVIQCAGSKMDSIEDDNWEFFDSMRNVSMKLKNHELADEIVKQYFHVTALSAFYKDFKDPFMRYQMIVYEYLVLEERRRFDGSEYPYIQTGKPLNILLRTEHTPLFRRMHPDLTDKLTKIQDKLDAKS